MLRSLRPILIPAIMLLGGCDKSSDPGEWSVDWKLKPPSADAEPFVSKRKMMGLYPVGSHVADPNAAGFARCSNRPKDLADQDWGVKDAVSVVSFPEELVAYNANLGFAVRVVNRSKDTVSFQACDSTLPLLREASDTGKEWITIKKSPPMICGNSVHRVFLGPGQYWEFPARQYGGTKQVKLRFRLECGENQPALYSNEFDGHVTAAQLAGK